MNPGLVPGFEHHVRLVRTALACLEEEDRARFATKTATGRAQREEAERKQTEYADRAITAKYQLRSLRRKIRGGGATPPHPTSRPHSATSTHLKPTPTPIWRNVFEGLHPPPLLLP